MKQYIFRVWRGWKSLFERSTGFSFPGALYGRRRLGTLLGTPFWGQKIILNSEYSARVLFNRATFFPEGPRRSWFDIFPRFHYCDSILRSTLCKNGHPPYFSQRHHLPWMGCHKETTMIIAHGQAKNTLNQLD